MPSLDGSSIGRKSIVQHDDGFFLLVCCFSSSQVSRSGVEDLLSAVLREQHLRGRISFSLRPDVRPQIGCGSFRKTYIMLMPLVDLNPIGPIGVYRLRMTMRASKVE